MMNHETCLENEKLFAFARRLLESGEDLRAREHVERCAACGQIVSEFRHLDAVLDEWKPAAPSAWFDQRVRAAVASRAADGSRVPFFGVRWAQLLAPACMMALVAAGTLMVSHDRRLTLQNHTSPSLTQSAKTSAAKVQDELTLYDNLPVLEDKDYDMLANFDVLSELPRGDKRVEN